MDEETSLILKKRRGKYRRNTGLLLSAMGCACDSTSAFSSITRNIETIDLANENYNNTNSLLLRSSDDEDTDERRREHDQAAIEASMKLIDHDAKHEGILSRVTKLVPIPKDDDDAVGDYLRFIHRRYNRFRDEIDEVGDVANFKQFCNWQCQMDMGLVIFIPSRKDDKKATARRTLYYWFG